MVSGGARWACIPVVARGRVRSGSGMSAACWARPGRSRGLISARGRRGTRSRWTPAGSMSGWRRRGLITARLSAGSGGCGRGARRSSPRWRCPRGRRVRRGGSACIRRCWTPRCRRRISGRCLRPPMASFCCRSRGTALPCMPAARWRCGCARCRPGTAWRFRRLIRLAPRWRRSGRLCCARSGRAS